MAQDGSLKMLDLGQALADTSIAILKRWGTWSEKVLQVVTDSGTVQRTDCVIRIGQKSHNWSTDWVSLHGIYSPVIQKFTVCRIEGNPFFAQSNISALVNFLASKDFTDKVTGSIGILKNITGAISKK